MIDWFAILVGGSLFLFMVPLLYRIWVGPTAYDRILAVNVIGTKTAVLLVVIGALFDRVHMFVDFAIAYALLNFLASVVVSRYLNRTAAERNVEEKTKGARA